MKKSTKGKKGLFIGLLLVLSAIICLPINPISANVPEVVNVTTWTSGGDTWVNITVVHSDSISAAHYVDTIDLGLSYGPPLLITLTQPQTTTTFTVTYNMGQVQESIVEPRAYCNLHGWSERYEPVGVPEFSLIHLFIALIVVSIAVLLLRFKVYSKKDKGAKR